MPPITQGHAHRKATTVRPQYLVTSRLDCICAHASDEWQRLRALLVDAALSHNSTAEVRLLLNRNLAGNLSSHTEGRGRRSEGANGS